MAQTIAVETDDLSLIELFELKEGQWGRTYLGPAAPGQSQAAARILLLDEGEYRSVATLQINLPASPAASVELTAGFQGRTLSVDVAVDGVHQTRRDVEIPLAPPRPRPTRTDRLLAALAVLLSITVIAAASWRALGPGPQGAVVAPAAVAPAAVAPAAVAPAAVAPAAVAPAAVAPAETDPGPAAEVVTEASTEPGAAEASESPEVAGPEPGGQISGLPEAALPQTRLIYFKPDDFQLTPEARRELKDALSIIGGSGGVTIAGHCALFGSERGRSILSAQRADEAYAYLLSIGWRPTEPPRIEARGGEEPVTWERNLQYLNRRVEIRIDPPTPN